MIVAIVSMVGAVVIGLQGWILLEIIALKVALSSVETKTKQNEERIERIESKCYGC